MPTKYPNILQLPFCCVPATLQKILYRHGLDILDQELIGAELGLRLPPKGKDFFSNPKIIYLKQTPKEGYGTQIEKRRYSINTFFRRNRIPLKFSRLYHFNQEDGLNNFLVKQFQLGNDVVLRYNNAIFKRKDGKSYGHFSLLTGIDKAKKTVTISDTELPFIKQSALTDLLFATSDQIDGIKRGFYLVSRVSKTKDEPIKTNNSNY